MSERIWGSPLRWALGASSASVGLVVCVLKDSSWGVGFDTLVQYSSGLADGTTAWALADPERRTPINAFGRLVDADRPRHLPVEALDFATGYQIAAAAIRGPTHRVTTGGGSVSRLSLARTAAMLIGAGQVAEEPEIRLPLDGRTRTASTSAVTAAR